MRPITENERISTISEKENLVYWSPIWAGVFTALVIGLIFNLLGAAIGFSIFLPKREVLWPLSIGAIIWLVLTGIISLYIAGWVAGRFSNARTDAAGILYGLLVSSVSTLISLLIMANTLGSVVSNSFSVVGNVISASASMVKGSGSLLSRGLEEISEWSPELTGTVKKAIDLPNLKAVMNNIDQQIADLLSKTDQQDKEEAEKVKFQLGNLLRNAENIDVEEVKEQLITTLVQQTGKSREEIEGMLERWQRAYMDAKEKAYGMAMDSTKKVAKLISEAALINFFILLSGVIAAAFGGVCGVRNKYNTSSYV